MKAPTTICCVEIRVWNTRCRDWARQSTTQLNKCQIECVVGEWDKDKSRYGVRVFFASGNSVWCEGAAGRSLLKKLAGYSPYLEYGYTALGDNAVKKFDEASKR